jgi:hypothetical protein
MKPEASDLYSSGSAYTNLTLLSNDIPQLVTPGDDQLKMSDEDEDDVLGEFIDLITQSNRQGRRHRGARGPLAPLETVGGQIVWQNLRGT